MALAAALPHARIVAVDLLPQMVAVVDRRIADSGLQDRVVAQVGDMAAPPVPPVSQDLIWCEGAIYNLGVSEALRTWRQVLRPGATVAFTEPVWLTDQPPDDVRRWWQTEYPAITDAAGIRARIAAASFETITSFALPASAWWDEYYEPMLQRIEELRSRHPDDPAARDVIATAEAEIDQFRRSSGCYSYAFFVVRPLT